MCTLPKFKFIPLFVNLIVGRCSGGSLIKESRKRLVLHIVNVVNFFIYSFKEVWMYLNRLQIFTSFGFIYFNILNRNQNIKELHDKYYIDKNP